MDTQLNKFEELKRGLYLIILPVIVTALVVSTFYNDEGEHFNNLVLPFLIILYSVSWFLVLRRKWFRYVELVNVFLISIIHLLKIYEIVYIDMSTFNQTTTGSSTYWTPLVFIFIAVTLAGKKGVIYCLGLLLLTVSIGFSHWTHISEVGHETLIQYYLSNFIYIIFLFFARHIISAYSKSEILEKLAFYDSLTGIANRRSVYQWIEEALSKEVPFTVIFFDIDHFKKINDSYGHVIGDKILVDIASIVQEVLKEAEWFGRWGGEEFIILSPKKDLMQAIELAEEIRVKIETHPFPEVDRVTSSFGVARSHNDDKIESLIKRVDEALYTAKENGRNQVRYSSL